MKSIMLSVCGLLACAASAFPLNPSFTPEAVAAYKAKADAGDAEAQYLYSSALANGRGVAEDKPQAFAYAKMAAEQGYERALRRVGLGYKEGWGIESNAVKAADCFARFVKWATEAAEKGDANAQCNLGWCYEGGDGVESNMTEAVKCYRQAAGQGDMRGQISMGRCYATGRGVEKDLSETVKWMHKAAEQGDSGAQLVLGLHYATGEGVKRDMAEAVKWYRKAAEQGDAEAQWICGYYYAVGEGVKSDMQEAVGWFRKSAEQGHAFAQNSLGWCYAEGKGVPKDMAEAVAWFRKAAEQGDFNAQLNLGCCYAAGEGVEKDVAESSRWYDRALQKYPSIVRIYRNFRWAILSLELIIIYVMGLLVFMAEYSPSIVLQYMRSKQHPFLRLSPGYPGLIMCLVGAFALWVGASCVDNLGFGENVVKAEFGSVGSVRMIREFLAIMHLFLQLAAFAFIYFGIRRFMKWRRLRVSLASPRLAYVQYKICVTAEMSACLIPVLWLAYILTLVGRPILVGASALALVALLVYTWPTRKKYAKIISGEMMKYIVIYREPAESKPKQVVLESCSEMSLRHECEDKGWQVLHIRPANEQGRGDRFVRAFTGELHPPIRFGVSTTELCAFCENVSKLCRIGILLPQIIDDCIQKEGNAWFRKRLLVVKERLQSGDSLATAMEAPRCVKAFPLSLRRRVRRGEASERLADSLGRFVLLSKFERTRREVVWNMIVLTLDVTFVISLLVVFSMIAEPTRAIGNSQLSVFLKISNCIHNHRVCSGFVLLLLDAGVGMMLWTGVKFFSTRIALWKFRRAMRRQKSKKAHFTESRGFVLLVVALVVVVLPFGLEAIGEATGLFSFPASRWMKEAFAILTR